MPDSAVTVGNGKEKKSESERNDSDSPCCVVVGTPNPTNPREKNVDVASSKGGRRGRSMEQVAEEVVGDVNLAWKEVIARQE